MRGVSECGGQGRSERSKDNDDIVGEPQSKRLAGTAVHRVLWDTGMEFSPDTFASQ
jgi:hypothetical protein